MAKFLVFFQSYRNRFPGHSACYSPPAQDCGEPIDGGGANVPCRPVPPGKGSGQGNTADYVICIPSRPGNTSATCQQFSQQLHNKAGAAALDICTRVHNVQCQPVTCQDTCVNNVTLVDTQDVYLIKNSADCGPKQDACQLGNTGWDCTCICQVQL